MRYKNLTVRKFRGIKDLEIKDFGRVNIFLGKNNSGKSSVLEAIFLLTGLKNPRLILNIDLFRNLAHNEENDFRFLFYSLDYNNTPEIYSDTTDRQGHRKLSIIPKSFLDNNRDITVTNTKDETDRPTNDTTSYQDNVTGVTFSGEIKHYQKQTEKISSTIFMEITDKGQKTIKVNLGKNVKDEFIGIYIHSNYQGYNDIHQRLEKLLIEKQKNLLLDTLRCVDKKITDIMISSNNMIYFDIGINRMIPSNLMGDGIQKYLTVITNIYSAANGILLIDEIDNGLHFQSMRNLWKIIFKLARSYNVQLFITSHSKETLESLDSILKEDEFEIYATDINCYTISKDDKDHCYAYKYDLESLDYALDQKIEIRGEI